MRILHLFSLTTGILVGSLPVSPDDSSDAQLNLSASSASTHSNNSTSLGANSGTRNGALSSTPNNNNNDNNNHETPPLQIRPTQSTATTPHILPDPEPVPTLYPAPRPVYLGFDRPGEWSVLDHMLALINDTAPVPVELDTSSTEEAIVEVDEQFAFRGVGDWEQPSAGVVRRPGISDSTLVQGGIDWSGYRDWRARSQNLGSGDAQAYSENLESGNGQSWRQDSQDLESGNAQTWRQNSEPPRPTHNPRVRFRETRRHPSPRRRRFPFPYPSNATQSSFYISERNIRDFESAEEFVNCQIHFFRQVGHNLTVNEARLVSDNFEYFDHLQISLYRWSHMSLLDTVLMTLQQLVGAFVRSNSTTTPAARDDELIEFINATAQSFFHARMHSRQTLASQNWPIRPAATSVPRRHAISMRPYASILEYVQDMMAMPSEWDTDQDQDSQTRCVQRALRGSRSALTVALTVNRANVLDSALAGLRKFLAPRIPALLLKVSFSNESGQDVGGLTREFLSELAVDMARPERGILIFNDENLAELNPRSNATEEDFAFLGLVFGLALANRETFPITFVPCFYQRMMNQSLSLTFDDLRLAHPRIHKSLESLRTVPLVDFDFTAHWPGDESHTDLVPDGSSIRLNQSNVEAYLHAYTQWRLVDVASHRWTHMAAQLAAQVPDACFACFDSWKALQDAISGSSRLSLREWREHASYSGGYTPDTPVVTWFWQWVGEMDQSRRARLLQFATGSPRLPLGGFPGLKYPFTISKLAGETGSRLMMSQSCFSQIKLPEYPDAAALTRFADMALDNSNSFEFA